THNEDTANVFIQDCRFINATDSGLHSANFWGPPTKSWTRVVGFYNVDKSDPDHPKYTPLDETLPQFNNSTLFTFYNTYFYNCKTAVNFHADGVYMKDCVVENCGIDAPAMQISSNLNIRNLKVILPKNHKATSFIATAGYGFTIQDSILENHGKPVPALTANNRTGEVPPLVTFRNCTLKGASSVLHTNNATTKYLPYWFDVTGTENISKTTCELLTFQRVPSEEEVQTAMFDYMPAVHAIPGSRLASPNPRQMYVHNNKGISTDKLPAYMKKLMLPEIPAEVLEKAYFTISELSDKDMEPIFTNTINAIEFGIDDDPATDDTAALLKAVAAAKAKGNALLVLPPVKILLSETVKLPNTIAITAKGVASIRQSKYDRPAFRIDNAEAVWVRNLRVIGGNHAFDIEAAPGNEAKVLIEKSLFYSQHSYSVKMRAGHGNHSRLQVESCNFIYPFNVVSSNAAESGVVACWISTNSRQDMSATIENLGGRMICESLLAVPVTSRDHKPNFLPVIANWPFAREMRWHDNHDRLLLQCNRYGGEYRGIPLVYNFTSNGTLAIDGGISCFFSEVHKLCMIYNFANPETTVLRNTGWGYVHGPTAATVKYAPGNTEKATVHARNFFYETDSFLKK
ncbi:MAG: hypothetical protein J6S21_07205, partial [Victivallales bacterium]|nr:hypothetical protein [Victivallales bacterium]